MPSSPTALAKWQRGCWRPTSCPKTGLRSCCRRVGFLHRLFRRSLRRSGSGADLPANAIGEDRGIHAPPSRHLRNAGARILVTVPEGLRFVSLLKRQVPCIEAVESVQSLSSTRAEFQPLVVDNSAATALIQYTSGAPAIRRAWY